MRKYLFTSIAITALSLSVLSQVTEKMKIDSLRTLATNLRDQARTDNLNLLSEAFAVASNLRWNQKADSVSHYASIAYKESIEIDYKKGIAQSLANRGKGELFRGIALRKNKQDDSVTVINAEKYLVEAIALANEIKNDEILGRAYYDLAKIKDLNIKREYQKKAIYHFGKSGNDALEGEACTWLCVDYSQRGQYQEGIEYCQRSIELGKKAAKQAKTNEEKEYKDYLVQQSLVNMSTLYKVAGDLDQALVYLRQSRQFAIENNTGWEMQSEFGELFTLTGKFDSAFILLKDFTKNNPSLHWGNMLLGETYLAVKDYDNALISLQQFIDSVRIKNPKHPDLIRALIDAGKANAGKQNYKKAFVYANEGFELASDGDFKPYLMDVYKLLSALYYQLGKNDKAYQYLLRHTELKDSILNNQFLWRLNQLKSSAANEIKESQIAILNKDNKIQQQQLKQEAQLKKFLVLGLAGLLLIGFFIFRTLVFKRKNDQLINQKIKTELHQKVVELEMHALRAQMNPHFIFNCLSSINRFIFKNDNKLASDYLTRFSRLIRMVLMNSSKKMITLEDELEMLRLYLDLERLRFKDAFDYSVTTTNIVDAGAIFIPPLLLQPFCENAVWHGLMHKETKGHLNVIISEVISEEDKVLHCIIEDDGVGRERAAAFKSKSAENEKSMGLKITTERLALLNKENNSSTFYQIEDILNDNNEVTGTRVQLKLRYKDSVGELV